jgi:cytochrome c biogenesis protein CcmG/thiol:disulfide interchange protein DsbE
MRRRPVRAIVLGVLIALSAFTLGLAFWQWHTDRRMLAEQSRPAPPQAAEPAPTFTLRSPEGTALSLDDLRGKVVLLSFWATWCPPCTAEMPDLNALYRRYGDAKDFVVVGVDLEESAGDVSAFARQHGISFPLALDWNGRVTRENYSVRTLPAAVIIDREGRIRDRWTGALRQEAVLARLEKVW